jgi:hypothetical protein
MATSPPEGKEVAFYRFTAEKNGKPWFYEMKLLRYDATQEFCFLRRWFYEDAVTGSKSTLWRHDGWHKNREREFDRKVVQKRDIMHYQLQDSTDQRNKQ